MVPLHTPAAFISALLLLPLCQLCISFVECPALSSGDEGFAVESQVKTEGPLFAVSKQY